MKTENFETNMCGALVSDTQFDRFFLKTEKQNLFY